MSRTSDELRDMGERGRRWMQEDFSWSHVGAQMAATYRWLLGRGDRPECILD